MSFFADYLRERTTDSIIESEYGFATYRFLNEGKSLYIIDVYVVPEARREGHAAMMADQVIRIAKDRGCTEMIGTVVPSSKNSTKSIDVLRSYGMDLLSAKEDLILFKKEI